MKEKLLKLIEACIEDSSMYTHSYIDNHYCGINEKMSGHRVSYAPIIKFEDKEVSCNSKSKFHFDYRSLYTQIDRYSITIGFGKEPQLSIGSVVRKDKDSKIIEVQGTYKNFFGKFQPVTLSATVINESYDYELTCGSFKYIIEESIVSFSLSLTNFELMPSSICFRSSSSFSRLPTNIFSRDSLASVSNNL